MNIQFSNLKMYRVKAGLTQEEDRCFAAGCGEVGERRDNAGYRVLRGACGYIRCHR